MEHLQCRCSKGEVQGYDFNRSVVEFTMLNQGKVIRCAVSTAAMNDLEGRHDVKPDQRVAQFMRQEIVSSVKRGAPMLRQVAFALACAITCALTSQLALAQSPASEIQRALAPTGKLRVALLSGDATQALTNSTSGELKGVGFDLGKRFAQSMNVPFEPLLYPSIGALLDSGKAGAWDIAFIGVTPARAKDWDFTAPHLEVEFGYLVSAGSSIATVADVDRPGIRVAVQERSGPDAFASHALKNAVIVRAPDYPTTLEMQKSGKADVIFSIKPILFELSDNLPGSRVLDGSPGSIPQALAIPKGRGAGLLYARRFIEDARTAGMIKAAVERAGVCTECMARPRTASGFSELACTVCSNVSGP